MNENKNYLITKPSDDTFMINASKNLIELYKVNEEDKSNYLKYYGMIVTVLITIALGLFKINFSPNQGVSTTTHSYQDYIAIFLILFLLYFIGIVILRKLFAVRRTSINLSIELGNIYTYFTNKYGTITDHIGNGFKIIKGDNNKIKFTNYRGSDFFTFIILQIINTIVLFFSFFFLIKGVGLYNDLNLSWVLYIVELIILIINIWIFKQFEITNT